MARIAMIKVDEGSEVIEAAGSRVNPVQSDFRASPDGLSLYVGEGSGVTSLVKLDLTQPSAPIALASGYNTLLGTDHLECAPDGSRIYLGSGQVLRTDSFCSRDVVVREPASVRRGSRDRPRRARAGDARDLGDDQLHEGRRGEHCRARSPTSSDSIVLPDGAGRLVLGDDRVCGLVTTPTAWPRRQCRAIPRPATARQGCTPRPHWSGTAATAPARPGTTLRSTRSILPRLSSVRT